MMSMAIGVMISRIDSGCSLDKEFTELIRMTPRMVLYLKNNHQSSSQIIQYPISLT